MVALPLIDIENGKPELAPGWRSQRTAKSVQAGASLDGYGMVWLDPENSHGTVVQRCTEDSTGAFYVSARRGLVLRVFYIIDSSKVFARAR